MSAGPGAPRSLRLLPAVPPRGCDTCQGLCCRLTVVLGPDDGQVPERHVAVRSDGLRVMARGADGYCVALGADHRRCGIYGQRPQACRRFAMDGPYCQAVREDGTRD